MEKKLSTTTAFLTYNLQEYNKNAQALVFERSDPLGSTTEFFSITLEEYGTIGSSKGDAHPCSEPYRRGSIKVRDVVEDTHVLNLE